MAASNKFCDICHANDETNLAEVYCPHCEEALCSSCKKYHQLSKGTKAHQVIAIQAYNELPRFIREIKQHCEDHGDLLEFYCGSHDKICCKRCIISTHKNCENPKVIQDLLQASDSIALESFEKTLQDTESNFSAAILDRRKNLEEIVNQKQTIQKEMKTLRENIEKHLDKLENNLFDKLNAVEEKHKQEISKLITNLEQHQQTANELQRDIKLMKKHASNIQVFIGTRSIQDSVSELEKYVQKLHDQNTFQQITLKLELNEKTKALTKDWSPFGDVCERKDKQLITIKRQTNVAAQIFSTKRDVFDTITAKLLLSIDVAGEKITSCIILQEDEYIFVDNRYPRQLLKYKKGKLDNRVSDSRVLFDVTRIDQEHVALTSGGSGNKQISVRDISRLQIKTELCPLDYCYGITYHKQSLYFCSGDNRGIRVLQMNNKTISDLPVKFETMAPHWCTYITSSNDYLYHSDHRNHSVKCFEFGGQLKWTFQDESLLIEPRGIAVDSNSNIYVAGSASSNVVVISPDGERGRQLLGQADNLDCPHAIYYDKTLNHLLICNYKGPAFVYNIE